MIPRKHDLNNPDDLTRLWFDVYDGPVSYCPLNAFERIKELEGALWELAEVLSRREEGETDYYVHWARDIAKGIKRYGSEG
jgi:RNA binding activity-knot of a chromodomain